VAGPTSALGALLRDTAAWCSELSEVLDTALEEEDGKEVAEIRCVVLVVLLCTGGAPVA